MRWNKHLCYKALQAFRQENKRFPTRNEWREYSKGKDDVPSVAAMAKHLGGSSDAPWALVKAVVTKDNVEKAKWNYLGDCAVCGNKASVNVPNVPWRKPDVLPLCKGCYGRAMTDKTYAGGAFRRDIAELMNEQTY